MQYQLIYNRTDDSLYQEEMEIRFCQCDANHRLKLSELFRILTNIADMAFEYRGMDHQFLLEKEMIFLITRFSVQIYQMPEQIQQIRVATWEQSIDRAQFIRNFAIWDENGALMVEASSGWILVNPVTRTILRPAQFEESFPGKLFPKPEKISGAPGFKRLRMKETDENAAEVSFRKIVYSDIDGNGHVDNARYMDMVMDALPYSLTELPPRTVQVVFSREAMLGEELKLYVKLTGETALIKGMSRESCGTSSKDSFICEVSF